MKLPVYLGLPHEAENTLSRSFRQVAQGHGAEPDVYLICRTLAEQCEQHTRALRPVIERYGEANPDDEQSGCTPTVSAPPEPAEWGLLRTFRTSTSSPRSWTSPGA